MTPAPMTDATPLATLHDHRDRPRHLGRLVAADVSATVGSIVVGRALRVFLKRDDQGVISDGRFQVFACQDQVGAASVAMTLAIGRTPEAVLALTVADLCAELGGLDPLDLPVLPWGLIGLHRAASTLLEQPLPVSDEGPDELLCRCHGIGAAGVRGVIAERPDVTLDELVAATTAGSGCGSCKRELRALLETSAEPEPPPARGGGGGLGRIGLLKRVADAATAVISEWAERGVQLELWDISGAKVTMRASGGDAAAHDVARHRLEQHLQDHVDVAISVVLAEG